MITGMRSIYNKRMRLPQSVEWALHCCWLLAQTEAGIALPRRRFAEFFELPEPYLAKVLQQMVAAGILRSVPGAKGGFQLSRPADRITALQVVRAVAQEEALFHCSEIRQRGPEGLTAAQCTRPCGIARVMHGAELAWRSELAKTSIADLIAAAATASHERAARWLGSDARSELRELLTS